MNHFWHYSGHYCLCGGNINLIVHPGLIHVEVLCNEARELLTGERLPSLFLVFVLIFPALTAPQNVRILRMCFFFLPPQPSLSKLLFLLRIATILSCVPLILPAASATNMVVSSSIPTYVVSLTCVCLILVLVLPLSVKRTWARYFASAAPRPSLARPKRGCLVQEQIHIGFRLPLQVVWHLLQIKGCKTD